MALQFMGARARATQLLCSRAISHIVKETIGVQYSEM